MILVLTRPADVHADRACALLDARGARYVRFDPAEIGAARLALATGGAPRARTRIVTSSGAIELDEVRIAWLRRPGPPRPHDALTGAALRRYVALELDLVLDGLWAALRCAWLPARYPEIRRADHKLGQLELAAALGFAVPATLITNDPAELARFYEAHGGDVIGKLATPAVFWTEPRVAVRYTQPVALADLGYAMSMLRYAPMLFQARVDKAREVRVTVVGDEVFAAGIETQRNARTRVDSRTDFTRTHYDVHALPAEVAERCRAITRASGLLFSTIDLVVTPDGGYVFLELNPNGQYAWIEDRTGLPITEAIAELLIAHEARDVAA